MGERDGENGEGGERGSGEDTSEMGREGKGEEIRVRRR